MFFLSIRLIPLVSQLESDNVLKNGKLSKLNLLSEMKKVQLRKYIKTSVLLLHVRVLTTPWVVRLSFSNIPRCYVLLFCIYQGVAQRTEKIMRVLLWPGASDPIYIHILLTIMKRGTGYAFLWWLDGYGVFL